MASLSSHAAMVEARLKSTEAQLAAATERLEQAKSANVVAGEALAGHRPVVDSTEDFYLGWAVARFGFWAAHAAAAYLAATYPIFLAVPIGTGLVHFSMVVGVYLRRKGAV